MAIATVKERSVCVCAKRRKRRRPGSRVRFRTADGKWHEYLNEAVPEGGELVSSLCVICGHGYSENIDKDTNVCGECRLQAVMAKAAYLESQGIAMGAGGLVSDHDPILERMKFDPRNPARAVLRW